jgi:hypothetical protein
MLLYGLIGDVMDTLAVFVAAVAVIVAIYQINESRKGTRAAVLLQFDERLLEYKNVHLALRGNGGEWQKTGIIPTENWYMVDGYMGLFERLNILVRDGIVSKDDAKRLYGYRLDNIVHHPEILRAKIHSEEDWTYFKELCGLLDVDIPKVN